MAISLHIDVFFDGGTFLFSFSFSGGEAPVFMIAYFVMSGIILRAFSPPFGKCEY
jgi:hypothetical protein